MLKKLYYAVRMALASEKGREILRLEMLNEYLRRKYPPRAQGIRCYISSKGRRENPEARLAVFPMPIRKEPAGTVEVTDKNADKTMCTWDIRNSNACLVLTLPEHLYRPRKQRNVDR